MLTAYITCIYTFNCYACGDEPITSFSKIFPADKNVKLVYESTFGETASTFEKEKNSVISRNTGDKFKYIQELKINEQGVFVLQTYQYIKLFLFITKEKTFTYNKPLLRLPFPVKEGNSWEWKGVEFSDGDSCNVTVNGIVLGKEQITTPSGNFDAYKVETVISSSSGSNNTVTEWYAENVGLVKARIKIDGGGLMGIVSSVLGYSNIEFDLNEIVSQ